MSSIRTNYERWYEGDGYYWGTEPANFLDELIALCPPSGDKKVLIGSKRLCGNGFRSDGERYQENAASCPGQRRRYQGVC